VKIKCKVDSIPTLSYQNLAVALLLLLLGVVIPVGNDLAVAEKWAAEALLRSPAS